MSNQQREIKDAVVATLVNMADDVYLSVGFRRRSGSIRYDRILRDCTQTVEVSIEYAPKDDPNAAAAVYPWLSVKIDAVDAIASRMVGNDDNLLTPSSPTLQQPIELTAPKGFGARWFIYQPDSIITIIGEFVHFSRQWLFPFMAEYSDATNVVLMFNKMDPRVLHSQDQFLRVVAAMVHEGDYASASETLQSKFGRPAIRRRFASAFEFVAQNQTMT